MRPRGAGLGRGSRRQAEAAKTGQRLLLKGRWGGRRGKLRLQVGWDSLDQQTALATAAVPRFAACSLATPQWPREAECLRCVPALVPGLCSAVPTPS